MKDRYRILNRAKDVGYHLITSDAFRTGTTLTMTEQLSRREVLRLIAGASGGTILTFLQQACGPLGDSDSKTDVTPHPTFGIDVTKLYPDRRLFLNTEYFGKNTGIREFTKTEIKPYENQMKKAANAMGWDDTNTELIYDAIAYIDQTGLEVPVIIGFRTPKVDGVLTDSTQMFMYTPFSDKEQSFVPVNQAPTDSQGRFFLIAPFEDQEKKEDVYFGLTRVIDLEHVEMTVPLFKVTTKDTGEKVVTAYEPYSGSALIIDKPYEAPPGAKKVIASLVSVETPVKELPDGKIKEIAKSLEGTDYGMRWSKDGKYIVLTYTNPESKEVVDIPQIKFDANGEWERTYVFNTPYGTAAEVTVDSRVDNRDTKIEIVETPDGKKILDFSGWNLVDGKWTREEADGEITYNYAEAQFILQDNGSQDPKDGYGIMKESDYNGKGLLYEYLDQAFPGISHVNGKVTINKFSDVIDTGGRRWWGTDIKTLDKSGQPKFIDTTNYIVHNLMSGKAIMIYKDKAGKIKSIIIDAYLGDLRNWSPYFTKAWF